MDRREPNLEKIFEIYDQARGIWDTLEPTISIISDSDTKLVNQDEFYLSISRSRSESGLEGSTSIAFKVEDENVDDMRLESHNTCEKVCNCVAS